MPNSAKKYYQHGRAELIRFIPDQYNRVLEIGCATGSFWQYLDTSKAEIWGIEPNEKAAKNASANAHTVLTGFFEQHVDALPDGYFDLVICNDVIEHLPDHDAFFQTIKTKMTSDATLIGSMPNVRYYKTLRSLLFDRDWPYADRGVLDRTHLRFFTKKSMLRSFAENDFLVEDFAGINSPNRFKSFILILNLLLLGTAWDSRFMQFSFRLKNK